MLLVLHTPYGTGYSLASIILHWPYKAGVKAKFEISYNSEVEDLFSIELVLPSDIMMDK